MCRKDGKDMTTPIEEAVSNYEALMCTLRTASVHELNTACSIMARAAFNAGLDAAVKEVNKLCGGVHGPTRQAAVSAIKKRKLS